MRQSISSKKHLRKLFFLSLVVGISSANAGEVIDGGAWPIHVGPGPKVAYKLVPIEECDMAPTFDPESGRITYPCGLKISPTKPQVVDRSAKSGTLSPRSAKRMGLPPVQVRYMGSTIHDNGDGTSTIDHGGSATETINTSDTGKTVKEYGDRGIKIIQK